MRFSLIFPFVLMHLPNYHLHHRHQDDFLVSRWERSINLSDLCIFSTPKKKHGKFMEIDMMGISRVGGGDLVFIFSLISCSLYI